jgi:hypothetical protein
MHSVPVPINVRCYSNSDIIVRRSEVTLRANSGLVHCSKLGEIQGKNPHIDFARKRLKSIVFMSPPTCAWRVMAPSLRNGEDQEKSGL